MKFMNQKMKYAAAVMVTTALPAVAMANDLAESAATELGTAKAAILSVAAVGIGLVVAMVTYSIIKSAIKRSA